MTSVHWPNIEASRCGFARLRGVPFLLSEDEEYLDGVNAFIAERVRGFVSARHRDPRRLIPKPLQPNSARALAYNLADFLRWAASVGAHPLEGVLDWKGVKSWHVTELYRDALALGHWTENFWATRLATPLAPETVNSRVRDVLLCYTWMAENGFVDAFEYDPGIRVVQLSKDDSLLSFRKEMTQVVTNAAPSRVRAVRRSPGDMTLPTLEHLDAFFSAIPAGAARLSTIQMFETGMRATEVVENTLIPGLAHKREPDEHGGLLHPKWSSTPQLLTYSLSDAAMIGVLPTRDHAWKSDVRLGYQCEYRIIGKGPKIRKVHLPPKLLQAIWAYVDGARGSLLRDLGQREKADVSAYVYLNRSGDKLSYHALWEACDRANRITGAPIRLTPHSFRHAYACYFLEAGLRAEAERRRIDPDSMTIEILQAVGEPILLTIKEDLGHSEFATTQKYLKQIIQGRIGLQYHQVWNGFLDNLDLTDD